MVDIEKQITYWRSSSDEDWEVAHQLLKSGRTRHGLFFAHLALEKLLKAHVCRATSGLAPRVHSLLRLADLSGLVLSEGQRTFLARFDRYQLEGRYPDALTEPLAVDEAEEELETAGEVLRWLRSQF